MSGQMTRIFDAIDNIASLLYAAGCVVWWLITHKGRFSVNSGKQQCGIKHGLGGQTQKRGRGDERV